MDGPRAGRLHLLGANEVLIGRRDDADIVIADASVSQSHARVIHRGDGYYLCDLESRNGTRLNGEAVHERRLRKKDRIQIGGTTLVFLEENAPEATLTVAVDPEPAHAHVVPRVPRTERGIDRSHPNNKLVPVEPEQNGLVDAVRTAIRVGRLLRRYAWLAIPLPLLGLAMGYTSLRFLPAPEVSAAVVRLTQTQQLNPVDEKQNQAQERTGAASFFEDPEGDFPNPELTKATFIAIGVLPEPDLVDESTNGLKLEANPASSTEYLASFTRPNRPPSDFPVVDFLERYLELYLAHEIEHSIRVIKAEAGFVENELHKLEKELAEIEAELLAYQKRFVSSLPEQAGVAISNKAELSSRRAEFELEVDRLRIQVANAQSQLGQMDSVVTRRVEDLKPLQTELEAKKRQQSDLRAKGFKPDHPEMQQLSSSIARIEREIDQKLNSDVTELERITDPRRQEAARQLQQYKGDLRVAESGLSRVSQQLGEASGIAARAPEVEANVMRLKRRQESLLGLRAQLFERHRKTLVQIDLETAQVRSRYEILAHADLQPRQTKKFLGVRLGGGFAGGLAVAILIAGVLELRRFLRQNSALLRV